MRGKHDYKAQHIRLDEVVWKDIIREVPCDVTGSEEETDENITIEVSRKRNCDESYEYEKRERKNRLSLPKRQREKTLSPPHVVGEDGKTIMQQQQEFSWQVFYLGNSDIQNYERAWFGHHRGLEMELHAKLAQSRVFPKAQFELRTPSHARSILCQVTVELSAQYRDLTVLIRSVLLDPC